MASAYRTQAEAAERLELSISTMRRYVADGRLPQPPSRPWGDRTRLAYSHAGMAEAKRVLAERRGVLW
jgi:predicted site-specific integrase-resolvase